MIDIDNIKIWLINGTTLFISLQSIDYMFKFILLVVSIGYTINKWIELIKKDPDVFPENKESDADNKKL